VENSFPKEQHVLLKPANVNILLSLNKDLLMLRLAIDFRRGLRYLYWYQLPAQKYLVLVSNVVSPSTSRWVCKSGWGLVSCGPHLSLRPLIVARRVWATQD